MCVTDAKNAPHGPKTETFSIASRYGFFINLYGWAFTLDYPAGATTFALVLRSAKPVIAIAYNLITATFGTTKSWRKCHFSFFR